MTISPQRLLVLACASIPTLRRLLVKLKGPFRRLPNRETSGAQVDSRYEKNEWATMRTLADSGRYGVLAEWVRRLVPKGGAVLDIGAGDGLLCDSLGMTDVDYLGVDFAAETIARMEAARGRPQRRFVVGDMTTYEPAQLYDMVIFSDMLYYLEEPVRHTLRLSKWLKPDGYIVVAMFLRTQQVRLLDALFREFDVVEQSFYINGEGRDFVQVILKPRMRATIERVQAVGGVAG